MTGQIFDLGEGHTYRFISGDTRYWPDTYGMIENHEDGTQTCVTGIIETHTKPDGRPCEGYIGFVRPKNPSKYEAERGIWTVHNLDPLDIDPSVQCACGVHGWIKQGKWRNA